MNTPSPESLVSLVMWPDGSRGAADELEGINQLVNLCEMHGFGRIAQLASQLEDLYHYPNIAENYEKIKDDHHRAMGWKRKSKTEPQ